MFCTVLGVLLIGFGRCDLFSHSLSKGGSFLLAHGLNPAGTHMAVKAHSRGFLLLYCLKAPDLLGELDTIESYWVYGVFMFLFLFLHWVLNCQGNDPSPSHDEFINRTPIPEVPSICKQRSQSRSCRKSVVLSRATMLTLGQQGGKLGWRKSLESGALGGGGPPLIGAV